MDLTDRRRGNRIRVELDEQLVDPAAELPLDRADGEVDRHGWSIRLQLRQRETKRLGQAVVEVAGHLSQLHQRALHVTQLVGDLLRRPQFAMAIECFASFGRCERLAGGGGRIGAADPRAHPGQPGVATQARSSDGMA